MRLFSLYRSELRRLLLSKTSWAVLVLCILSPAASYAVIEGSSFGMTDRYLAGPVLTAASINGVLWAAAAVYEAGRLHRSRVCLLADAAASPRLLSAARTAALLVLSAASALLCACLYLPYTAFKMEYVFDLAFYWGNYLIFLLPAGWISILLAEAFYQITRRVETAVMLYGVSAYFSFSGYAADDYFMRWLNPRVTVYSDGFSSWWFLRMGCYTRLLWLCLALGLWFFAMICVRKYEKKIAASFLRGMRRICLPVLSVFFAAAGAGLWVYQPFIDQSAGMDQNIIIDSPVTKASAIRYYLDADPVTGCLSGRAEYDIENPYTGEDRMLLNPGYRVKSLTYGGQDAAFRIVDDDTNGLRSVYFTIPQNRAGTLKVEFGGFPQQRKTHAAYVISSFADWDSMNLGMSSTVPVSNITCEDGAFAEITIPEDLTLYLNDSLVKEYAQAENGRKTWKCQMQEAMVYNLVAGRYRMDSFTAAGTDIQFVYGETYAQPVEQYNARQSVADVFEYCTEHYGRLWLAEDKTMTLQQVSAMLMGGQARPGYLEWFETVLSPETLADPARGASATEVFIHEMIHQWWGGFGLECRYDEAAPFWSQEGLAVYSTYRLVKEKYGSLYAKQYYTDVCKKAVQVQERDFYNRHPEYLEKLPEKYRTELIYVNEGTNQYQRMPLMILKAEKLAGGEEKMDRILRNMYADREAFRGSGFSYQDFLEYCGLDAGELKLDEADFEIE